jgi:hypothetical protein
LVVVPHFFEIRVLLRVLFLVHLDDAVPGLDQLSPLFAQNLSEVKIKVRLAKS